VIVLFQLSLALRFKELDGFLHQFGGRRVESFRIILFRIKQNHSDARPFEIYGLSVAAFEPATAIPEPYSEFTGKR
jgi:hypothetical protein